MKLLILLGVIIALVMVFVQDEQENPRLGKYIKKIKNSKGGNF